MRTLNKPVLAVACAVAMTIGGAAATSTSTVASAPPGGSGGAAGNVVAVPGDYPTIQEAVDAAAPGDLVLISPGTYHEAVDVTTDDLTIRGLDRNTVVLDGEFELDNGIRVFANGVAVENMTAMNYTANGFFWTGIDGYRGSYLTAYRIGDYGVYAFDSTHGQFDNSYAAGSPDAGFYVGQCYPCDAVITNVEAEHNGLGYSGTNSGGNLFIVNSSFHNNRAGIVPNSGSYELCYPERETTIAGNLVYSNNQGDTPAIAVALLAMGNGIILPGGYRNLVTKNRVWDHDVTGIAAVPFPEDGANDDIPTGDELDRPCAETRNDPINTAPPDSLIWDAHENSVIGNVVSDSRVADLAVGSVSDPATLGNCFADNDFTTSQPADLETLAPCDGEGSGDWSVDPLDLGALLAAQHPESIDYQTAELPPLPELPNMPDAATAPASPAVDLDLSVDVDAIAVPDAPAGTDAPATTGA